MILTCPECATRYLAKDKAIGPNGSTVRCSKCEATWFVAADIDELAFKDNQTQSMTAASVAAAKPVKSSFSAKLADETADLAFDKSAPDNSQDILIKTQDKSDKPSRGAHVDIRDKADDKRRLRRLRTVGLIWLIPLSMLFMAIGLAYIMRHDIVRAMPNTATLYKAIGIDVSLSGLAIDPPITRTTLIDNKTILVVNGTVRNISSKTQDVPLIKFSLHDKSGAELTSWFVETDAKSLEKNERVNYVSEYPNPPLDAVGMRYQFEDVNGVSFENGETPQFFK